MCFARIGGDAALALSDTRGWSSLLEESLLLGDAGEVGDAVRCDRVTASVHPPAPARDVAAIAAACGSS